MTGVALWYKFLSYSAHQVRVDSFPQLEEMRKNEDPRLSFSTPEFKEAQRIFTDGLKVKSQHSQLQTCSTQVFKEQRSCWMCQVPRMAAILRLCVLGCCAEKLRQAGGVGPHQGPRVVHAAAQEAGHPGEPTIASTFPHVAALVAVTCSDMAADVRFPSAPASMCW